MGNKPSLEDLIKSKQLIPASALIAQKEADEMARAQFEQAILDQQSLQKSQKPRAIGKINPIYSREGLED
jgi:hypothetical protein